jgi:tetratricopeptide (TPR) repeat protein
MTYADVALAAAKQLGDERLIAEVQFVIARVRADQGRWEEARSMFEAYAAELRRRDDAIGTYEVLLTIGDRLYRRGLYDEAEACLAEALANVTRVGQGAGIAHCQLVLGKLAHARGVTTRAAALLAESLTGFRTSGHRHYIGAVLVWLSRVALAQGDEGEAQRRLDEGLALFRELDDHAGIARALWQAARLARHRDQFERATALLKEGLVLVRGTEMGHFEGDHIVQFEQLEGLAGLAAIEGGAVRAARLFGAAAAQRSMAGLVITPPDQEGYTRDIAAGCAQLDAATWDASWAEGQAMSLEQAIAYALGDGSQDKRGN